jgi:hypothetical protein
METPAAGPPTPNFLVASWNAQNTPDMIYRETQRWWKSPGHSQIHRRTKSGTNPWAACHALVLGSAIGWPAMDCVCYCHRILLRATGGGQRAMDAIKSAALAAFIKLNAVIIAPVN